VPSDGRVLELDAGAAVVIDSDGATSAAPVVTTGPASVLAGSTTFGAELTGTRTSADGRVTFTAGGRGRVRGFGFQPGTTASVWIMSTPERLGIATVASDGSFVLDVAIPSGLDGANHTIQVQGIGAQGSSRAIATGVLVATKTSLPVTGGESGFPMALGGALLLSGAGLALTAQTRRRMVGGTSRSTNR
jgi:LPXTG-motif cell wall-anchored protein